jgi:cyclic pyranopterin phosphate synthase
MPLSHYTGSGRARMVDISAKPPTRREAVARAQVVLRPAVLAALARNPKGDPLETARLAGIMAAKQTAALIPLCHTLPLSHVDVVAEVRPWGIEITTSVATTAATGVEMEALTAAAVAALTVYDMCKALDRAIEIREIVLLAKSGGRRGAYTRAESSATRDSSPASPPAARTPARTAPARRRAPRRKTGLAQEPA